MSGYGVTSRPLAGAGRASVSSTAAFRVDRVRLADLRAVAAIQRRAFRPGLAYGMSALLVLRFFPRTIFLVARDAATGAVIGCGIADRYRGDLRIMNLAVDPSWHRRGVGGGLLRRLERLGAGGDSVLTVEEWNAGAQALYTRHGYARVGFARDYYGRNRHGIWMKKSRSGDTGGPTRPRRLYV
jgi:ribosomal-protein-alanine N-acetyltransferase